MADQKISQLSDGGASQATDEYVVARSGANYRIDGASVAAAATSVGTLTSLTVSGDLTVDTNTLKVDSANNRVGVGTASPLNQFSVASATGQTGLNAGTASSPNRGNLWYDTDGSGWKFQIGKWQSNAFTAQMTFQDDGKIGIGTASPATPFDVTGIFNGLQARFGNTAGRGLYVSTALNGGTNEGTTILDARGASSGRFVFQTDSADRMTLDASGNLGLGVTPSYKLHVQGSASSQLVLQTNDTNSTAKEGTTNVRHYTNAEEPVSLVGGFTTSTTNEVYVGGGFFGGNAATLVAFYTAANNTTTIGTERARITSGGYFKASDAGTYRGSTAAYHELRQSASDWTVIASNTRTTGPYGAYVEYSAAAPNGTGNEFFYCSDNAALRASIRSNGGIANYQANNVDLSDARTKTDITPAASMWDKVAALEIVAYKYIDQTHDDVNLGVIAQQVETVEPVWVDSDGFGETPEGEEPFKTVYTKDITFAAIKALQEAMARIEALEARLEALEA